MYPIHRVLARFSIYQSQAAHSADESGSTPNLLASDPGTEVAAPSTDRGGVRQTEKGIADGLWRKLDESARYLSSCLNEQPRFRLHQRIRLNHLPNELLQQIAKELPEEDKASLAKAYPALSMRMPEVGIHYIPSRLFPKTLEGFKWVLEGMCGWPAKHLVGPLEALADRLHRLPDEDQEAACEAFLNLAKAVPESRLSPFLATFIQVAEKGPAALNERARTRMEAARHEAMIGQNVHVVAQEAHIYDPGDILELEQAAVEFAGEHWIYCCNREFDEVAEQLGISNPDCRRQLRFQALTRDLSRARSSSDYERIYDKYQLTRDHPEIRLAILCNST